MRALQHICLLLFFLAVFVLPTEVIAQQGSALSVYGEALKNQSAQTGLVTCTGLDCDACKFADMVNGIINWLFGFMAVLAVIVLAVAGFRLVTSGGDVSAMSWAKERIKFVIIGFLLMLASWLIVDTLLRGLTGNQGLEVWGTFQIEDCGSMVSPDTVVYREFDESQLMDSATYQISGNFTGAYGAVRSSPAGQLCFNGPDGRPNTGDDACVAAQNLQGGDYQIPGGAPAGYVPPGAFLGPDVIAANPQISPNFRLCDVTNCDAGRRQGDYIFIDPFAVAQLERVRQNLGGSLQVNSGYRSPGYNAALRARNPGAATHSRHMYGDAFDIAITSSNSQSQIYASCEAAGATNIYTYSSGSHVHCDWRGASR